MPKLLMIFLHFRAMKNAKRHTNRIGFVMLGCVGLCWVVLGWVGLCWVGLCCVVLWCGVVCVCVWEQPFYNLRGGSTTIWYIKVKQILPVTLSVQQLALQILQVVHQLCFAAPSIPKNFFTSQLYINRPLHEKTFTQKTFTSFLEHTQVKPKIVALETFYIRLIVLFGPTLAAMCKQCAIPETQKGSKATLSF